MKCTIVGGIELDGHAHISGCCVTMSFPLLVKTRLAKKKKIEREKGNSECNKAPILASHASCSTFAGLPDQAGCVLRELIGSESGMMAHVRSCHVLKIGEWMGSEWMERVSVSREQWV